MRYFLALCDEQHFGHAAKISFVSQSAFSDAIQELEKIRKQYPLLELLLIEDQTQRIYDRLMDGELDLLLLALHDNSYRNIGLAWRKGSQRVEEFQLLGTFFRDTR